MAALTTRSLTLIDQGGIPDRGVGDIAYWRELIVPAGSISLPQLVEAEAEILRDEYVDWCGFLAKLKLRGTSLPERLSSRLLGGGSFWWTTSIAQRSPMASQTINAVLRLRALERHYVRGGYTALNYCGMDSTLASILRDWCRSIEHTFQWWPPQSTIQATPRSWLARLPHSVRALLYVGYFLFGRYWFARSGASPPSGSNADLVIVSYFPNIDLAKARAGEFASNYWGPLPDLIRKLGLKITWIWFYANSTQLSYAESAALRSRLNAQGGTHERFLLLEDHLSLMGIFSALSAYAVLWFKSFCLGGYRQYFRLGGSYINFFPLLASEWRSSLRGTEAMKHCLYAAAFSDTLSVTGSGKRGLIYLWENQGWEQLLLYVNRRQSCARTIAAVHSNSCTAPMYMRTCLGGEAVGVGSGRPLPDQIVTMGEAPRHTLAQWGWPAHHLHVAEALRYMQLRGQLGKQLRDLPEAGRRLLVVTGYMRSETEFQVRLLAQAARLGALDAYAHVTVKPHPYMPVDDILGQLNFPVPVHVATTLLQDLFEVADVVYAANSTSAGVEAAWVGLPIVLAAAVDGLNLSPLMGLSGATFVAGPEALECALKTPQRLKLGPEHYKLDADLQGWEALLAP